MDGGVGSLETRGGDGGIATHHARLMRNQTFAWNRPRSAALAGVAPGPSTLPD
jgi:hypothetical protein